MTLLQYIETSRLPTSRLKVTESRTQNPLYPEHFVFHAKAPPDKRSEKGGRGMPVTFSVVALFSFAYRASMPFIF